MAVGDLAHTLVLERLDELSQQLRDRDSRPLFIISSVEYDNYLAKLQRRRFRRKQRKASTSKDTKTSCSAKDEVTRKDSDGKECKGKQLLPPKPADRGTRSGEIDVLLLHEQCGVVLVEVSLCLLSSLPPVRTRVYLQLRPRTTLTMMTMIIMMMMTTTSTTVVMIMMAVVVVATIMMVLMSRGIKRMT